jgi:nanoRNase/pAp phosphatase (c-di-AMP/oligoRNAs hydrolase)
LPGSFGPLLDATVACAQPRFPRISDDILSAVDKADSRQNTVFAIGKSSVDRSSPVDIGALCSIYGGGGHVSAGACQIESACAADIMAELINKLTSPVH